MTSGSASLVEATHEDSTKLYEEKVSKHGINKIKCTIQRLMKLSVLDVHKVKIRSTIPRQSDSGTVYLHSDSVKLLTEEAHTSYSQPCFSANALAASSLSKLSPASPTLAYGSPVDVQPINGFSHLYKCWKWEMEFACY